MSARLESAVRWLRLAFACLALVAAGLPAQASAQPEVVAAVAVQRSAQVRPAPRAAVQRKPWLRRAPRSLGAQALRLEVPATVRGKGSPRAPFLVNRALLR